MQIYDIIALMVLYFSEVIMLYLIMNNIAAFNIKESFENFVINKQRILWENGATVLVYLGFLGFILFTQGAQISHTWAHVATPVIVVFLIKTPTVSKVCFGILCQMVASTIVYVISLPFTALQNLYFTIPAFLILIITVVIFKIPQKLYEYIESERILLTLMNLLTAALFAVPFFGQEYPVEVAIFLPVIFIIFMAYLYAMNKETMTQQIKILAKSENEDEIIDQLKNIATSYEESEILLTFTIKNVRTSGKFATLLTKKLEDFGKMSEIRQDGSLMTVRILTTY